MPPGMPQGMPQGMPPGMPPGMAGPPTQMAYQGGVVGMQLGGSLPYGPDGSTEEKIAMLMSLGLTEEEVAEQLLQENGEGGYSNPAVDAGLITESGDPINAVKEDGNKFASSQDMLRGARRVQGGKSREMLGRGWREFKDKWNRQLVREGKKEPGTAEEKQIYDAMNLGTGTTRAFDASVIDSDSLADSQKRYFVPQETTTSDDDAEVGASDAMKARGRQRGRGPGFITEWEKVMDQTPAELAAERRNSLVNAVDNRGSTRLDKGDGASRPDAADRDPLGPISDVQSLFAELNKLRERGRDTTHPYAGLKDFITRSETRAQEAKDQAKRDAEAAAITNLFVGIGKGDTIGGIERAREGQVEALKEGRTLEREEQRIAETYQMKMLEADSEEDKERLARDLEALSIGADIVKSVGLNEREQSRLFQEIMKQPTLFDNTMASNRKKYPNATTQQIFTQSMFDLNAPALAMDGLIQKHGLLDHGTAGRSVGPASTSRFTWKEVKGQ